MDTDEIVRQPPGVTCNGWPAQLQRVANDTPSRYSAMETGDNR